MITIALVMSSADAQTDLQRERARESWQRVPDLVAAPHDVSPLTPLTRGIPTERSLASSRWPRQGGRRLQTLPVVDSAEAPIGSPRNVAANKRNMALHAAPWCFCG
jgi:hypothetical protein